MRGRTAGIAAAAAVLGVVACTSSPPEEPMSGAPPGTAELELDCDSTESEVGTVDYDEDATGGDADPVAVVREYLGEAVVTYDLELGVVEDTRGDEPVVGVERDGRLIGLYYLIEAPAGHGLLIGGHRNCVDEALMRMPTP